jgi:hypothetical protein
MPKLSKAAQKEAEKAGAESGSFEPLKPGIYHLRLRDLTVKEGAKGPYWKTEFDVIEPGAHGRQWTNISQSKAAKFKVAEFFAAFNADLDTDTDELLGRVCRGQITIGTIQQGDRAGEATNELKKLLPASEDFVAEDDGAEAVADY